VWFVLADLAVLIVVLGASTAFGSYRRRTDGRLKRQSREPRERLRPADLGAQFGVRGTLVQISTPFCQSCRRARRTLEEVAASIEGVGYVEVRAEDHCSLVRRLGVLRTPAVLLLDGDGCIVGRGSGMPDRTNVLDSVQEAL
jgi:hypothetical protein